MEVVEVHRLLGIPRANIATEIQGRAVLEHVHVSGHSRGPVRDSGKERE
jgi:hypothetical protein